MARTMCSALKFVHAMALAVLATQLQAASTVSTIIPPDGSEFVFRHLSPNGEWVTGYVLDSSGERAAVWSEQTGLTFLPHSDASHDRSWAWVVSNNGRVLGTACDDNDCSSQFWHYSQDQENFQTVPTPSNITASLNTHISADGDAVAGTINELDFSGTPAVWREPDFNLELLEGIGPTSLAGMSSDGRFVYGSRGRRWDLASDPPIVEQVVDSDGNAVERVVEVSSSAKELVVGLPNDGTQYLWEDGGLTPLPSFRVTGLAEGGESIVGWTIAESFLPAVIWKKESGLTRVSNLVNEGVPAGFVFGTTTDFIARAVEISSNGFVLAGAGLFDDREVGWVVYIPEPGTGIPFVFGLVVLTTWRHQARGWHRQS